MLLKGNFMKKSIFGLILFILYCFANASTPDNKFCFKYGNGVSSVTLQYNGISQDSEKIGEVSYSSSDKQSCIYVKSERKNTEETANGFNKLVNSDDNKYVLLVYYGTFVPALPEKLHFYIGTNVSINGVPLTNDLFLAQGHYSSGNNWWVATNSGYYNSCKVRGMTLTDSANNKYCILSHGNLHEVTITAGQCEATPWRCQE